MKNTILMAFFIAFTGSAMAQSATDFDKILGAYYTVKNDLATDKGDQAASRSKSFSASVASFPVAQLTVSQKALWNKEAAILKKSSDAISNEKDIKAQRKQFEDISYSMIRLVKGMKSNSATVYLQHCPMAKASWLNEVAAVQNPYYGSMMYDCGDVKEVVGKNGVASKK